MDRIIEKGAELGVEEFVFGMAHRGRLNALVNVFGKEPERVFFEFDDKPGAFVKDGRGDVKYHKGHTIQFQTRQERSVHLGLAFNPSHLEFVDPIIEGHIRARQENRHNFDRTKALPVLIHGDAAFSGQGIVYETLNLSRLNGYSTGGTIHIIINNNIGFTTSPKDSRSTRYPTDLGKMLEAPVFHVNGDDPEAVWFAAELSAEYRQRFGGDIFLDIVCYRRYGHNEGDEPSFTQPLKYKIIKKHPSTPAIYSERMAKAGIIAEEKSRSFVEEYRRQLTKAMDSLKEMDPEPDIFRFDGNWEGFRFAEERDILELTAETSVSKEKLSGFAQRVFSAPKNFRVHPKLKRILEGRLENVQSGQEIDWGSAELLAYASLVDEGFVVRLSGQDSERGTFSHRHSVFYDFESGERFSPLEQLEEGRGRYEVFNSSLSEAAVLGFEFGYAQSDPRALVMWEAQFGDFANGAQVIIDQFISSSEAKWQRMAGLVMMLPHGNEGQGPEHSSARLERFLQLSANGNWIIANVTTPAQFFHLVRRQMHVKYRKPLILMTPKSLLRHPMAISSIDDFSQAGFQEIIDDSSVEPEKTRKIIFCSGKVYYDLLARKSESGCKDVALIRVEQLYPLSKERIESILSKYKNAEVLWVQEEPRNMGAWGYFALWWPFERGLGVVAREPSSSPASGSAKLHAKIQNEIVERALK
jgi:2-oxoglutarate dehydrogenase E1 component